MSAEICPVCGAEKTKSWAGWDCGKDAGTIRFSGVCSNAERLAIERGQELDRLKNESITAEIELAAGQPALMLSAYDMPIHWRPGDVVRITLERPETL